MTVTRALQGSIKEELFSLPITHTQAHIINVSIHIHLCTLPNIYSPIHEDGIP